MLGALFEIARAIHQLRRNLVFAIRDKARTCFSKQRPAALSLSLTTRPLDVVSDCFKLLLMKVELGQIQHVVLNCRFFLCSRPMSIDLQVAFSLEESTSSRLQGSPVIDASGWSKFHQALTATTLVL